VRRGVHNAADIDFSPVSLIAGTVESVNMAPEDPDYYGCCGAGKLPPSWYLLIRHSSAGFEIAKATAYGRRIPAAQCAHLSGAELQIGTDVLSCGDENGLPLISGGRGR